ncbi:hypothetical protein M8C21_027999, partial [Ambrosia artemisiifolia]
TIPTTVAGADVDDGNPHVEETDVPTIGREILRRCWPGEGSSKQTVDGRLSFRVVFVSFKGGWVLRFFRSLQQPIIGYFNTLSCYMGSYLTYGSWTIQDEMCGLHSKICSWVCNAKVRTYVITVPAAKRGCIC